MHSHRPHSLAAPPGHSPSSTAPPIDRLLELREVEDLTGLRKSAIYVRIREGQFPAPVSRGGRSVAWRLSSITSWIERLPETKPAEAA